MLNIYRAVYLLIQSKFSLLIANSPFVFCFVFFFGILTVKKTNN